ncbi:M20/M25/M40 family metallo-hydrolase, partial [bacterium]
MHGAKRVMACCDKLARCSDSRVGLTRTFLSPAMDNAHELVAGWMREAGMTPHIDEMGNLIGHYPGVADDHNGPVFLLGSHLDTVPNAGKYDGILGVMLAIEAVASLEGEKLPFAIEVVGFSEEEGVRYKTPYLGSRAL